VVSIPNGSVGATGLTRNPGLVDLLELLDTARPAWMRDALCREYPDVDWYATTSPGQEAAKRVCRRCLVRNECEVYGITHEAPVGDGVWGGLSAADRRTMRRGAA